VSGLEHLYPRDAEVRVVVGGGGGGCCRHTTVAKRTKGLVAAGWLTWGGQDRLAGVKCTYLTEDESLAPRRAEYNRICEAFREFMGQKEEEENIEPWRVLVFHNQWQEKRFEQCYRDLQRRRRGHCASEGMLRVSWKTRKDV
jgi:hypothetical protein